MVESSRLNKEKEYLETVKKEIENEIKNLEIEIVEIPKRFTKRYSDVAGGDEDLIETLIKSALHRKEILTRMRDNCYFGQFAFANSEENIRKIYYIGKSSVVNNNSNLLVLDWRAPISSLYYEQDLGDVSYDVNGVEFEGFMDLKSQIKISDGKLIDIIDTDVMTKDELILPYLRVSATDKMKDIVASIQKEQNEIIRRPINKNIIIQGVAGSGKTSVALHRIAYLLYQYKNYKPDQFLIIGPNNCFNNYTSMVLPDLDSEGIQQTTFIELFENYKLKAKIIDDNEKENISNYKTSLKYKKAIDRFIDDFLRDININVELDGIEIISSDIVGKYLDSMRCSFKERINIAINKCTAYIKSNTEKIEEKVSLELKKQNLGSSVFTKRQEIMKKINKNARDIVKKSFSKLNCKVIDLYKQLIENLDCYDYNLSTNEILDIQKTTLDNLNKNMVTTTDIPALLYLSLIIEPKNIKSNYVHIAVDEAQDYGLFHFEILRQIFPSSTFSIYGDLAQSIDAYKSINNWEELNKNIFNDNAEILYLNENYRTTKEITEEANKVLGRLNLPLATSVLRTGKPVSYIENASISDQIKCMLDNNYSSIALICKNEEEAQSMFKQLHNAYSNIKLVRDKDSSYFAGLCIIDVTSSKGLEFDSVIINNAGEDVYSSQNISDQKKLYVAMTRALHELRICYNGELTAALNDSKPKRLIKED